MVKKMIMVVGVLFCISQTYAASRIQIEALRTSDIVCTTAPADKYGTCTVECYQIKQGKKEVLCFYLREAMACNTSYDGPVKCITKDGSTKCYGVDYGIKLCDNTME